MKRLRHLFIPFVAVLWACEPVMVESEDPHRLVVEGWMDAGGHPLVTVTWPAAAQVQDKPASSLASHVIQDAVVTVTADDGTEYRLTGQVNRNHLPPYVYTTEELTGQVGHTYTLKVIFGNHAASGSTTIPAPVPLERLTVTPSDLADSLYMITAYFPGPPAPGLHYRFFTQIEGKDTMFYPSVLSGVDAGNYTGSIPVTRGWQLGQSNKPLYYQGEVVHVRLCTMDDAAGRFWNSYDEVATLGTIPFFTSTNNARSNLTGAFGYWAGYGVSTGTVVIP